MVGDQTEQAPPQADEKSTEEDRPPRSHRLILPMMVFAFLVGLADILLITVGNGAIEASATEADFRLVEFVRRSTEGDSPSTGALLSGSFKVTFPRQLKTRLLSIDGIELFSEDGESLGSGEVSLVEGSFGGFDLPGLDAVKQLSGAADETSSITLSPLGATEITFRATSQQDLGLADGSRVYAEIAAQSGGTEFTVVSDSGAVSASI